MANRMWFTPKSIRRIKLRSCALLVGKAPTKEKRIKALITMALTGQKVTGFPTWLADARDFTMKTGETVKCSQAIAYCSVSMSDENLFQKTPIEAPKSKLSHFTVENEGESDDPTTVVKFQILTQFSTDLWRWFGQMGGEEFDSTYEITEAPEDDEDEDGESGESAADEALKDDPDDEQVRQRKRREEKAKVAAAKKNLTLM